MSVADLCRREGASSATKWRAKFGGMQTNDAKRLRNLKAGNNWLKKLLAEAVLDNEGLKGAFGVKRCAHRRGDARGARCRSRP